uniref:Putative glia maturation factor beta n=1 Tax=Glossina morsitans morsitans TaxID=37546 RepID=D3TRZ1_GLOMM
MGDSKICDISDDVRDELRKFRFRKSTKNSALILKINREKQLLVLDELLDDISVRELHESLPGHQPRYVIYTYKMIHDDSRISYPMCFIFYTPRDSQMELQMMYAYTKSALQREINLTRVYEIRELDELTEEWLKEKLK